MYCKDCKYYNEMPRRHDEVNHGRCDSKKFVESNNHISGDDALYYWDYESYSAEFEVGEMFGCIHFKIKESK